MILFRDHRHGVVLDADGKPKQHAGDASDRPHEYQTNGGEWRHIHRAEVAGKRYVFMDQPNDSIDHVHDVLRTHNPQFDRFTIEG